MERTMAIIGVILLVLVAVFALENRDPVTIKFLGWQYYTVLSYAMIAPLMIGAFILYVAGLFRHRELRAQIRDAELRLREAERQRSAPFGSPAQSAGESSQESR
ncbi:MAG: LapA family protein [bacterium]